MGRGLAAIVVLALTAAAGLMAGGTARADEAQAAPERGALDGVLERAGAEGAILIRRLSDGAEWTGGGARVDERFVPASTFKIANSLIFLETGIVADPYSDTLEWDGVERMPGWDSDQTLATAFRRSAVWAYQHWARHLGHDRMESFVDRLDYGNGEIGGADNVALFWLQGPLEISAREQVDFLQRLEARALGFRPEVQDAVVDIMLHDEAGPAATQDWALYAKTGWAIRDEPNLGWFVGWLETPVETWFFAVNVDLDYETGEGALRERLARAALVEAGAPEDLAAR